MPPEGAPLSPRGQLLTRAELTRLVRVLAALGVRKLRLTGGEPTLRADLPQVVGELAAVPGVAAVAMTTNGVVLTRALPALQRAGLGALNVSLDSLRPARYERLARRAALPRVLAGLDLALQLGCGPLKVNTVLMRGEPAPPPATPARKPRVTKFLSVSFFFNFQASTMTRSSTSWSSRGSATSK